MEGRLRLTNETLHKIGEHIRERKAQHMIDAPYIAPLLAQIGVENPPTYERVLVEQEDAE